MNEDFKMPWLSRRLLWLDNPAAVTWIFRGLLAVCAGLVILGVVFHLHGHYGFETIPGFYGLYGFIMCALLVIAAKGLRILLKRPESYYAPHAIDSEESEESEKDHD